MIGKKKSNKQQIITEYLTSEASYNELSEKHGIKLRTIQTWVRGYRQRHPEFKNTVQLDENNSKDLRKSLEHAELKSALLEEILILAEEHTGIDLRKKFGAKQS